MRKSYLLFLVCLFVVVSSYPVCAEDSILALQQVINNSANGLELFNKPYNLALTADGHLLVVDQKFILQKFTLEGTRVEWTAGLPESANPVKFASITVTEDGFIYFAHKIAGLYILTPNGQLQTHINLDQFSWLDSIVYNAGDQFIYLADNSTVHVLTRDGVLQDSFKEHNLWQPCGITVSPKGYIYVADTNHQEIKVFDPWGELLLSFGSPATTAGPGQLDIPFGVAVDQNSRVYVTNYSQKENTVNSIMIYSEDGRLLEQYPLTLPTAAAPIMPTGIIIKDNQLFVTDFTNSAILIFEITDIVLDTTSTE